MKNFDGLKVALNAFLYDNEEFAHYVLLSTKAGFSGGSYKVELYESGEYRVHWSNSIGNMYKTPGILMTIPQISTGDYNTLCDYAVSESINDLTDALEVDDSLDMYKYYMREKFEDIRAEYEAR